MGDGPIKDFIDKFEKGLMPINEILRVVDLNLALYATMEEQIKLLTDELAKAKADQKSTATGGDQEAAVQGVQQETKPRTSHKKQGSRGKRHSSKPDATV